ncbi:MULTISPECIES: ATP-binding cassette domain-containing protein [Kitasatospora]|uniref:Putative ABC transporter ATP-binding protein n=1 Tax=Kitasatospora setae (strain ATCC 33774 / DSM 43861 / JCM 3304 / KCC A-0304 / NBRC 14216 / KM-6054) TaxID=452652 RepID=E4NHR0_KITSK|nr:MULTISPECIES: ATP-binding cassette domain-containing protein [Kitasatospora]BAJ31040.1 putative ABC transporter ATP-binding protein [Kitasatospora setae KM-6054]
MSAAPPDSDVLWARGIVKSHHGTPALRGVSLGVREGEMLAVTGPRGSGKSTLLGCLSAQLPVDEGEVWFHGAPVHTLGRSGREKLRRERFGYVGPEPQLVPELTARENVALPLLLAGAGHRAAHRAAGDWLERLDVAALAKLRPAELRQDLRQRIAVARALAAEPPVVFADDPTAPLHRDDREQVLRILASAARSHRLTLVLATHDPALARFADRTVRLVDGRLAADEADEADESAESAEPAEPAEPAADVAVAGN